MCYTGICKYETYMGTCRATKEQRITDCLLADDYGIEHVEQEDEDE